MNDGSWFHANCTTVKRSAGRNAVATAAYCAGLSLHDETERTTHDYSRKPGVVEAFVTTPEGKAGVEWAHDIAALSNAMEKSEKRKDSQVGHVWNVALSYELDDEQRSALTHDIAQRLSDKYGVAVIVGIHEPDEAAGSDKRNHHAHFLLTAREVEEDGKLGAKVTSITDRKTSATEITDDRSMMAEQTNEFLEAAGLETRVSHLSNAARGLKEPTTHLVPAASAMERDGQETERGDENRAIIAARIAEQEKLAAAIARHVEESPPELTLETERELARRFGEEWRPLPLDAKNALPVDGQGEWQAEAPAADVTQAMHPELERVAIDGTTHTSSAIHRWMQAQTKRFFELLRDESGAPRPAAEATPQRTAEPSQEAETDAGEAEGRSWISRIVEAGRNALHNWQRRAGGEEETPDQAGAVATGPPTETAGDDPRPGGNDVAPLAPDADRPQDGQERAMSAFERLAASVETSPPPEAPGGRLSAFHQVTAEPAEAAPARPPLSAPEAFHPSPEL